MVKPHQITIGEAIECAKEVAKGDPIDWPEGYFSAVSQDTVYNFVGLQVFDMYNTWGSDRELIMLASLIKLTVENFILNLRLEQY